jgi:hypothetical protein
MRSRRRSSHLATNLYKPIRRSAISGQERAAASFD